MVPWMHKSFRADHYKSLELGTRSALVVVWMLWGPQAQATLANKLRRNEIELGIYGVYLGTTCLRAQA